MWNNHSNSAGSKQNWLDAPICCVTVSKISFHFWILLFFPTPSQLFSDQRGNVICSIKNLFGPSLFFLKRKMLNLGSTLSYLNGNNFWFIVSQLDDILNILIDSSHDLAFGCILETFKHLYLALFLILCSLRYQGC